MNRLLDCQNLKVKQEIIENERVGFMRCKGDE